MTLAYSLIYLAGILTGLALAAILNALDEQAKQRR